MIHNMTIVIRSVFQKDGKYYPQSFLDERLYELQKREYNIIDISEGTDASKINASKECDIFIIGTLKILVLNMNHIFVMVVVV